MGESYLSGILIQVGINIILAISLYITFSTGQVSLGHAGFMAIGGYLSSYLTVKIGIPFGAAIAAAAVGSGIFGLLVGYPALRLGGLYLAIATLGFGIIVQVFFENFAPTGGSMGMQGMTGTTVTQVYILVVAIIYLTWQLMNSRWGRAFEAVRDDEIAAKSMGINITSIKLTAFVLGAAIAGIAGCLDAHYMFYIDSHNYNFGRSVEMLLFLILGGSEVIWGPVLGAAVLTALPEALRFMREYRMVFYGFIMMFMMIVRPQGILDRRFFISKRKVSG
jgi:branched-chain amino acid transport system permease protein